jgi:hypothetical protein
LYILIIIPIRYDVNQQSHFDLNMTFQVETSRRITTV